MYLWNRSNSAGQHRPSRGGKPFWPQEIDALALQRGVKPKVLRSCLRSGFGAAVGDLLLQMQSDFGALTVERPTELESTAGGAAMFAGPVAGLFSSPEEAARMIPPGQAFISEIDAARAAPRSVVGRMPFVGRARTDTAPSVDFPFPVGVAGPKMTPIGSR